MGNSNECNHEAYDLNKLTKKQAKDKAKQCLKTFKKEVEESEKIILNLKLYDGAVDSFYQAEKTFRTAVGMLLSKESFVTRFSKKNEF